MTNEMMNVSPGEPASTGWVEMHNGLSRIRRLYEKGILSEIEAAVKMQQVIGAAIEKHVMAAGDLVASKTGKGYEVTGQTTVAAN
jgi:hypothetical protein